MKPQNKFRQAPSPPQFLCLDASYIETLEPLDAPVEQCQEPWTVTLAWPLQKISAQCPEARQGGIFSALKWPPFSW